MTRKRFSYVLFLLLFCLVCTVPALADTPAGFRAPWVTRTGTTSATINWWQETPGSGTVDYAPAGEFSRQQGGPGSIADAAVTQVHHVVLSGLEPGTSYTYRVRPSGSENVFQNRTFRTLPTGGPFTFIVISDTHAEENRFRYVADALNNEKDVLFILDGGDYAGHDNATQWSSYFQSGDGILANHTIVSAIGNHEYHNYTFSSSPPTAAYQYRAMFGSPLNYSFDCAGVRFVVLDSPDPGNPHEDDPQTSLSLAQRQASWLREQLDTTMAGTFVIHHHPIWSYGSTSPNPDLQPWETLFHTYPISADFAGHVHNYERYSVGGIPYFILGTAGGKFDVDIAPGEPHPAGYQYGETLQLGYLRVTVDPAHNTATAQEIFVARVQTYDAGTATVLDPPVIADTVTFPLRTTPAGSPQAPAGSGNAGYGSAGTYPEPSPVTGVLEQAGNLVEQVRLLLEKVL